MHETTWIKSTADWINKSYGSFEFIHPIMPIHWRQISGAKTFGYYWIGFSGRVLLSAAASFHSFVTSDFLQQVDSVDIWTFYQ
jgi:hypothetical protein